ncbi:MAG: hypothetical protein U0838_07820 [Chloroflexota bacterium]
MSPASYRPATAVRLAALALATVTVAACLPATLQGHGPRSEPPAPTATAGASLAVIASSEPSSEPTLPPESPGAIETPTPEPSATPKPPPVRKAVSFNLITNPARHFITEERKTWCAASGTQMVLAMNGKVQLTAAVQAQIVQKSKAYWSYGDSHNKGWGPLMMAKVLDAYGVQGYVVREYRSRDTALLEAAKAIEKTHQPAILLVWWGAHTWVMTGFKATADPLLFSNAKVTGAYILDPWYPRVSSIWGPSDPPGTFQDAKEMVRNYRRWSRPEGRYAERDGMFVAVLPTIAKP